MRRTKQWWSALTKQERVELHWLERAGSSRSSYIPDDCSECGHCGTPHLGSGLCPLCLNRLLAIREKAIQAIQRHCNVREDARINELEMWGPGNEHNPV